MRTGIGLATGWGGNIGMPDVVLDRVGALEHPSQVRQYFILRIGERPVVGAFEFDSDREVVAAAAAAPLGLSSVPGTPGARDELEQFAITPYQEVAGNLVALDLAIVRVGTWVKAVGEQFDDARPAELARRKTDAVNDQQLDVRVSRPFIAIW